MGELDPDVEDFLRSLGGFAPPGNRKLAFVDLETTGFRPLVNCVIDVAVIRDGLPWESKIKISPFDEARTDASARGKAGEWRNVTGYTREEWASAPTEAEVAPELARQLHGATIVGHNVAFDLAFCESLLERHGIPWRSIYTGSSIDTLPLCKAILGPLGLKGSSLEKACLFLGIPPEGYHRAMGGASRCRSVFHEICKLAWGKRDAPPPTREP